MKHIIAHQFIDGFNGNPHFPAEQRVWLEILVFVEAFPSRFGFDQIPFKKWLRRIVQRSCRAVGGAELRTRGWFEYRMMNAGFRIMTCCLQLETCKPLVIGIASCYLPFSIKKPR
ncbi:hypothetical protein [Rhodohalobacter barkolensis]|uniref:Uncharacterized protein n=1 Tax=Rhodohalobacter barkolensis TaxID=2053187 RepID=A0A2N0VIL5_9BACT|nr:hypothetical protein [Rhodohalobacter barkolensis]PKD44019.1 hypothetical protein CWD77_00640 [Rhodohalobacter barkolensis]